ncbi:MAG: sulfotransferase domain-containing protein [Caldilineaceae bacterium]
MVGIGRPAQSPSASLPERTICPIKTRWDGTDGTYWGHLVSWWEQRHNAQVLLLTYEGMKANLAAAVEAIAHFLEIELDQPLRELVLKHASLEFMLAHQSKFSDPLQQAAAAKEGLWPPGETTSKVNKGQVGAHRTELPAEICAEMDAIWRDVVKPQTGLASYQDLLAALA